MDRKRNERIVDGLASVIRVFNVTNDGKSIFKVLPLDPKHSVLIFLKKEDLTMSELGKRLMRSKPNMTAIINCMIKDGVVRRMSDPKDRRVVRISITQKGRKVLIDRKKSVAESIARNLGRLDDADLKTLCASLESISRIAAKLGRD